MESGLIDLFNNFAKSPKVAILIDQKLSELQSQFPDEMSIGLAMAAHRLRTKDPRSKESVHQLSEWLGSHPLESIPEGRKPNNRQRKEAAAYVPLWIVARECLEDKVLEPIGKQLADASLTAARRQVGTKHTMTVLVEWSKQLLAIGDLRQAEEKLAELLKIATERPQRKAAPEAPKTSALPPPNRSNPLSTVAQLVAERSSSGEKPRDVKPSSGPIAPLTLFNSSLR